MNFKELLKLFLKNSEIEEDLKCLSQDLMPESDRGAVLIATELIDSKLESLFRNASTSNASKRLLKKLLEYPGALSNFSAKADVSFALGFIGEHEYSSIKSLKKIRNKAAHSRSEFKLKNFQDELKDITEIAPNLSGEIDIAASNFLFEDAVKTVMDLAEDPDGHFMDKFSNREDAVSYIEENPDTLKNVEKKQLKVRLLIGILLLCIKLFSRREDVEN